MRSNQNTQEQQMTVPQEYVPFPENWQSTLPNDCCRQTNPDDPGCDCCYDNWKEELKSAKQKEARANEISNSLQKQYAFIAGRRDNLKNWKTELEKLDDLVAKLCAQFDIIIEQTTKICINSDKTVEAIEILFCMIRDLFLRIDKIKAILEEIKNCINCLNSSQLTPNSGIMKCLGMYEEKLMAVIKTRDDLIKLVMQALKTANMLNMDICNYGLAFIMNEWKLILNCGGTSSSGDPCRCHDETHLDEHCRLKPMITLPVHDSDYLKDITDKYNADVAKATQLLTDYTDAKKKKEALTSCVTSLTSAMSAVDATERCK